jgi:hypothetical protein
MISFKPLSLCPQGTAPRYPRTGRWMGPTTTIKKQQTEEKPARRLNRYGHFTIAVMEVESMSIQSAKNIRDLKQLVQKNYIKKFLIFSQC